ncbi:hypothetical protein BU15DRAFT_78307 [Melanogaster broomeanus]|nr:hypothetical protein BU15DRAFT_78307 [Melanogaster broomeanus]
MWLSHWLRSFQVIYALIPFLCHEVAANTEIINFSPSQARTVDLPSAVVGNWSELNHSNNERQWALRPAALHTPLHQVCEEPDEDEDEDEDATAAPSERRPFSCPHELWVFLDLDDEKWAAYSTFTLRLSWAASTPADFSIEIHTPEAVLARLSARHQIPAPRPRSSAAPSRHHESSRPATRSRYARIRAVDAGVLAPRSGAQQGPRSNTSSSSSSSDVTPPPPPPPASLVVEPAAVPFIVILEPLYWGVLPASLLPAVGFLLPILLVAAMSVPWIIAYLDTYVQQAREDLTRTVDLGKKER